MKWKKIHIDINHSTRLIYIYNKSKWLNHFEKSYIVWKNKAKT
jgi:ribosomal protein S24E